MTNKDKDQVLIPMVTTIEAALDYGYSMKDIRLWRIGNRMCTVILVPGTKDQYDSYLSSFSKEFKAEDRDKRCQISDGKGHAIRCPESNKCKDCPFYHSLDKKGYGTLTLSRSHLKAMAVLNVTWNFFRSLWAMSEQSVRNMPR